MSTGTKTCPECAEEIKAAAVVCRYCGHRFDGNAQSFPPPPSAARPPGGPVSSPMPEASSARPFRDRWHYIVPLLAVMAAGVVAIVALLAVPKIHKAAAESTAKADRASDASAMSAARLAVTEMESYFADNQTYDGLSKVEVVKSAPELKNDDLQIDAPSSDTYIVVVKSKRTHNRFAIGKDPTGEVRRQCEQRGRVGCPPSGEW